MPLPPSHPFHNAAASPPNGHIENHTTTVPSSSSSDGSPSPSSLDMCGDTYPLTLKSSSSSNINSGPSASRYKWHDEELYLDGDTEEFTVDSNVFAFSPGQLSKLHDPKSLAAYQALGGIRGLEKGLRTDLSAGLSADEGVLYGSITFQAAVQWGRRQPEISPAGEPSQGSPEFTNASVQHGEKKFPDRRQVFGEGCLREKSLVSLWRLMWERYNKSLMLLSAGAIALLVHGSYQTIGTNHDSSEPPMPSVEWVDGVAIIAIVAVDVVVGAGNKYRNEHQLLKLNRKKEGRKMGVIRSGEVLDVSVHDIFVGDVVCISPGDILPVDGVLISGGNVKCDEAALIGESAIVRKTCGAEVPSRPQHGANIYHIDPFMLAGGKVLQVEGVGTYLATGVGARTRYGKAVMAANGLSEDEIPLILDRMIASVRKVTAWPSYILFIALGLYLAWVGVGSNHLGIAVKSFLRMFTCATTLNLLHDYPLAASVRASWFDIALFRKNSLARIFRACETMKDTTMIVCGDVGPYDQHHTVTEAVGKCRESCISVIMATSENFDVGTEIATRLGILESEGHAMNVGRFLSLTRDQGRELLSTMQVFTGCNRESKQVLVLRLREMGETVAVTENNTTDLYGSSVHLAVAENGFLGAVSTLLWSRVLYNWSIEFAQYWRKTVLLTVALLIIGSLISALSGNATPYFSTVQLLWVTIIMEYFAAFGPSVDFNTIPAPVPLRAHSISIATWETTGQLLIMLACVLLDIVVVSAGIVASDEQLKTSVFNTLVWMHVFNHMKLHLNLTSAKPSSNRWRWIAGSAAICGCQVLIILHGGDVFSVTPLSVQQWALSVGLGSLVSAIGALQHLVCNQQTGSRIALLSFLDWVDSIETVSAFWIFTGPGVFCVVFGAAVEKQPGAFWALVVDYILCMLSGGLLIRKTSARLRSHPLLALIYIASILLVNAYPAAAMGVGQEQLYVFVPVCTSIGIGSAFALEQLLVSVSQFLVYVGGFRPRSSLVSVLQAEHTRRREDAVPLLPTSNAVQ